MDRAARRTARTDRSVAARRRRRRRARGEDDRRHRDPHSRRGRAARSRRPARVPQRAGRARRPRHSKRPKRPTATRPVAHQRRTIRSRPASIVNRVWQHLFGQGLVTSVDNFGMTGDAPVASRNCSTTSPRRFVRDGWSVKTLVRTLVLTRAYQLSSAEIDANVAADPGQPTRSGGTRRAGLTPRKSATPHSPPRASLDRTRPEASPARESEGRRTARLGAERQKARGRRPRERQPQRVLAAAAQPDADVAGGVRLRRAGHGHRQSRRNHRCHAGALPAERRVRPPTVACAGRASTCQRRTRRRRTRPTSPTAACWAAPRPTTRSPAPSRISRTSRRQTVEIDEGQSQSHSRGRRNNACQSRRAESNADAKDEPPQNPDEIPTVEAPVIEETIVAADPHTAAWASLCQALFGSAEFRYEK